MPAFGLLLAALSVPAPVSLADADRFPSGAECQAAEDFARLHLRWLEVQAAWSQSGEEDAYWRECVAEARWCFDCWDAVGAGAANERPDAAYRLQWLARLRELIGDEDYFAGRLPPPVPVWRFRRLD